MSDISHDEYTGSGDGTDGRHDSQLKRPVLIAVDLGAENCRVSLLRWVGDRPEIRLVHRFPNSPTTRAGGLRWDIGTILQRVEDGVRACAQLAPEGITAVGVEGWAVDYVRLGRNGVPIGDPFCYRDQRTVEAQKQVHRRISPARLYQLTGTQILPLNTLYQLYADPVEEQDLPWINLPEYVMHRLGGNRVSEYTNATHTQLLAQDAGVRDPEWCREIFDAAGLDLGTAPPLVQPGALIGRVQGPLASLPVLRETLVIAPACHDTASAIAAIPGEGDHWGFVSSGTWSLVGCVIDSPCVSEAARSANFSNEGGVGGKIYFLKNVNGMWLLRQCIEHWRLHEQFWTVQELIAACADLGHPDCLLDVDDPDLLLPGDMPGRINAQLRRSGQAIIPEGPGLAPAMANLIFHSLAQRYATVLQDAIRITGRDLKRLYVVGGGSRNALLNRLTARATGLEVVRGSSESTTVGNFAIQLAALSGEYADDVGVSATGTAKWANLLSPQPIRPGEGDEAQRNLGEAFIR